MPNVYSNIFPKTVTTLEEAASIITDCLVAEPKLFFLYGDLGAGKTTLTKAVLEKLGSMDEASSPTYALVNEYEAKNQPFYHIDLYRLNDLEEALDMGIEEYIDGQNPCFVEWAQLIEPIVEAYWKVEITIQEDDTRKYTITKVEE